MIKSMFFYTFLVCQLLLCWKCDAIEETIEKGRPYKVLHLTFHKGCLNEIEGVAKEMGWDLTTWFVPDLPPCYFDGTTKGNALYNIGHERADRIWILHKEFFSTFDVIITSDTAPLARVFLQNAWKKPLVIWICNRFDYADMASLDCNFPDQEFYDLFRHAKFLSNVAFVAYTNFEHYYAKSKGVDTGSLTITPCASNISPITSSSIPSSVNKKESFFLPPYHNEIIFTNLSSLLSKYGLKTYCGHYNGSEDLKDFKAIIHLPYAWSNLALFENMQQGTPYFLPSKTFLKQLLTQGNYFFTNPHVLLAENRFDLAEWYSPEHQEIFTYFDSWFDLKVKTTVTDIPALREKVKAHGIKHKELMLNKWRELFQRLVKE